MPTLNTDLQNPELSTTPAQEARKTYHSPEFREYGTVGDLTHTSAPITPVNYDTSFGYINSFPTT